MSKPEVLARVINITRRLSSDLQGLTFSSPVAHVYNPLEYARASHEAYLEMALAQTPTAMFLGMNPGPWGMAQTGVPFGEVAAVRDWLGIDAHIGTPPHPHPKRPVLGLQSPRSEVSGRRLWGWAQEAFETPAAFFQHFFVANYCPLLFLEEGGRNRTPDKLKAHERAAVQAPCDVALRALVACISPQWVIGVGAFAEKRALAVLDGLPVNIGRILHPSPASPAANRGWAPQAQAQLERLGVPLNRGEAG